jgi:hypothetical protein
MSDQKRTVKAKENFIEALKNTLGNISLACDRCNIARTTYYNWISEDKSFHSHVKEIEERNLDFAESQLLKGIKNENATLLIFYLKTKGKNRGYVERQEFEFNKDKPDLSGLSTDELLDLVKDAD